MVKPKESYLRAISLIFGVLGTAVAALWFFTDNVAGSRATIAVLEEKVSNLSKVISDADREQQKLVQRYTGIEKQLAEIDIKAARIRSDVDSIRGPKGEKGDQGTSGKEGNAGSRGKKGDPGVRGQKGELGLTGDLGARGKKGDIGVRSEKGEYGLPGNPGPRGEKGDPGARGKMGIRGFSGDIGLRGKLGDQGIQGERGAPGTRGRKGERGDSFGVLDRAIISETAERVSNLENKMTNLLEREESTAIKSNEAVQSDVGYAFLGRLSYDGTWEKQYLQLVGKIALPSLDKLKPGIRLILHPEITGNLNLREGNKNPERILDSQRIGKIRINEVYQIVEDPVVLSRGKYRAIVVKVKKVTEQ